jgi:hypothetical protein
MVPEFPLSFNRILLCLFLLAQVTSCAAEPIPLEYNHLVGYELSEKILSNIKVELSHDVELISSSEHSRSAAVDNDGRLLLEDSEFSHSYLFKKGSQVECVSMSENDGLLRMMVHMGSGKHLFFGSHKGKAIGLLGVWSKNELWVVQLLHRPKPDGGFEAKEYRVVEGNYVNLLAQVREYTENDSHRFDMPGVGVQDYEDGQVENE